MFLCVFEKIYNKCLTFFIRDIKMKAICDHSTELGGGILAVRKKASCEKGSLKGRNRGVKYLMELYSHVSRRWLNEKPVPQRGVDGAAVPGFPGAAGFVSAGPWPGRR
jgi:hypothetical protein